MHCASCVARVERVLARQPGVTSVTVSLPAERATITGHGLDSRTLAEAINNLGFEARPAGRTDPTTNAGSAALHDPASERTRQDLRRSPWRWRVLLGICIVVPLKTLHWFHEPLGIPMPEMLWVSAILGTTAAITVGWPFFTGAVRALRAPTATMDTLVALGASAALLVSWAALIQWARTEEHAPVYFAEAAALLTLIAIGRLFESRLAKLTTTDTRAVLEAQPHTALKLESEHDRSPKPTPTDRLSPGDLILVPTGERIPVDATLVDRASSFDESIVTGESIPVERAPGETAVAGAINTGPPVILRATVDGRSTTIARIAAMIERARASSPPAQRLADRITAIFVPAILAIATLSFLIWWLAIGIPPAEALIIAATVLVIACPCALGLATPLAVMAGVGGAARHAVFLRDAAALQRAADIKCIVFDKTGTITAGRPRVIRADDHHLALAAAICAPSSHPIARAIHAAARQRHLAIPEAADHEERPGAGMSGTIDAQRIRILSLSAARAAGIDTERFESAPDDAGASLSLVLRDDECLGAIALRDEPRPDASRAIQALRRQGVILRMLSGDRASPVHAIASAVGLERTSAMPELSPQDKLDEIARLAEDPRSAPVAMVGDGINDAPALAQASSLGGIAIAIGSGTAAAIESSDAIVPGERLMAIPMLLAIGKKTLAAIRTNLALAFAYNTFAIPAAALGLLGHHGPLVAAIAMALSNICVVGNSALLARSLRAFTLD